MPEISRHKLMNILFWSRTKEKTAQKGGFNINKQKLNNILYDEQVRNINRLLGCQRFVE